jgi:heptosyltransferase-1
VISVKTINNFKIYLKPKYVIRFIIYIYLSFLDKILNLHNRKQKLSNIPRPRKILLTNLAHAGDVINATSVLPVLKKAFPEVKVGFIVGSHSIDLIKDHPLIDYFYVVDHWILNRSKVNILKKIIQYIKSYQQVKKRIKQENFDTALDLYFYIGKGAMLTYRAHIPIRIGYNMRIGSSRCCGGNLLTHRLIFRDKGLHITEYYKDLLRMLSIDEHYMEYLKPTLGKVHEKSLSYLLSQYPKLNQKYIVLHPGTGAKCKEWPDLYWLELLGLLLNQGLVVVITGRGVHEKKLSNMLTSFHPQAINLVDQLSWSELRAIYKNSSLVVGVDSQAGHLAAELNVLTVLIYTGIRKISEWAPKSDRACILYTKVSCSPCYRGSGCKTMDCIRGVKPLKVFMSILEKLEVSHSLISR